MSFILETKSYAIEPISYGVTERPSYLNDSPITIQGDKRPKKVWNIIDCDAYEFRGSAFNTTIYTEYKFTGKTSYSIDINNYGGGTLTVKAKSLTKTYAQTQLGSLSSTTLELSGMKEDAEFYLVFQGSSFSGKIY